MRNPLLPWTLAAVTALGAGNVLAQDSQLETSKERFSYGLGLMVAERLQRDGVELDPEAFGLAIKDIMEDRDSRLTAEQIQQAFLEQKDRQQQAQAAAGQENVKAGEAFRKQYAQKKGTVKTDSGLMYRVIEAGEGEQPDAGDRVTVEYRGTLVDGTEFDSSYSRGEPTTFTVGDVIPGWQEALKGMKEGAHWEVVIPPELAYGAQGAGGAIGPNETLVFDIKLLEVNEAG